jgi:hypothetical protein
VTAEFKKVLRTSLEGIVKMKTRDTAARPPTAAILEGYEDGRTMVQIYDPGGNIPTPWMPVLGSRRCFFLAKSGERFIRSSTSRSMACSSLSCRIAFISSVAMAAAYRVGTEQQFDLWLRLPVFPQHSGAVRAEADGTAIHIAIYPGYPF